MLILGIGNILQKDDGLGIYAASFLNANYMFLKPVNIINGGVEGIHLLNVIEENKHILILDSIELKDESGSIYAIPAQELSGYGLNNGGAHEIGIIQCMDMLELQGKEVPTAMVLGIVPSEVTFDIALSETISDAFDDYISVVLQYLEKHGIQHSKNTKQTSLQEIIDRARDPSRKMI